MRETTYIQVKHADYCTGLLTRSNCMKKEEIKVTTTLCQREKNVILVLLRQLKT